MKKKKIKAKVKKVQKKKKALPKAEFVNFLSLNKQAEASLYFGFTPIKNISVNKDDIKKSGMLKEKFSRVGTGMHWLFSDDFVEERIAVIREYIEKSMQSLPQPVMLVHESENIKERGKTTINLEILGTERPIAEALLIKTAVSILKDDGVKNLSIDINSIGDKESINKFTKDLIAYYKKNLNSLAAHCRQNFKKDPFYLLPCNECDPDNKIKSEAPTSIGSLSDVSRDHFKEVLEFIETIGIPYNINTSLVPDRKYGSGTIFEIKETNSLGKESTPVAQGFRFDGLAQKLGNKRDVPGVGIKIFVKKKTAVKKISKLPKPKAFYIQLGDEAKHKSLDVIEKLRDAEIFVFHMLGRDKFGSQFSLVEKSRVPFVLIMGKKEFLDNTVLVRENLTRVQDSVPIATLPEYLKKRFK